MRRDYWTTLEGQDIRVAVHGDRLLADDDFDELDIREGDDVTGRVKDADDILSRHAYRVEADFTHTVAMRYQRRRYAI